MGAHRNIAEQSGPIRRDPNIVSFTGVYDFTIKEFRDRDRRLGYMIHFDPVPLGDEEVSRFHINGDGTCALPAENGRPGYDRIFMTGNYARQLAMYGPSVRSEAVVVPDQPPVGDTVLKVKVGMRILETLSATEE